MLRPSTDNGDMREEAKSERTMLIAVLLVIFLPFMGAHRLYAGRVGSGLLQLCMGIAGVSMITFGYFQMLASLATLDVSNDSRGLLFMGLIVSAIAVLWAFCDLVTILTGRFRDVDHRLIGYS